MTETEPAETPAEEIGSTGEWAKRLIATRTVAFSMLLAAVTGLAWGARWHWILDLLAHFPVQIAATSFVLLAILLALRQWKAAIWPAGVLAFNLALILPLYLPARQPNCPGPVIRAISANVLRDNLEYRRFIAYVRDRQPDFFVVLEMDDAWDAALKELTDEYPHNLPEPLPNNFGIGLFSRVPIADHEIIFSEASGQPMIRARLDFDGRPLDVLGVHPLPPTRRGLSNARNRQLREIAELSARLSRPRIVLGDLNITSWSPYFADLLERGGLRDGRQGFGVQPTWPGLFWLARIPIDHTLVSNDVEVVARRVGPDVGSDHRPVEIDFRIGK